MVLTMVRIAASKDAWGYLMSTVQEEAMEVTGNTRASYYVNQGTPNGMWLGNGALALGLDVRKSVTEQQLSALFGQGAHPDDPTRLLGRKFTTQATLSERVEERVQALDPDLPPEVHAERVDMIVEEEGARQSTTSVSGFELVFSPPKSVSSWWAMADPALKDQIRDAHHAALCETIKKLERDVARTRTGDGGVAQLDVQGVTAAAFDHYDNREGDPQLHTHVLVSNRVQGIDGKWRTLDSRFGLSPAMVSLSMYYDTVLMDTLSMQFGVEWTVQEIAEHPERFRQWLIDTNQADSQAARARFATDELGISLKNLKWQIAGVPQELNDLFSARSKQLVAKKDEYIERFEAERGRRPNTRELMEMRKSAARHTRKAKRSLSLRNLTQTWRAKAATIVGDTFLFAERIQKAGQENLETVTLWSFRHDDVPPEALDEAAQDVRGYLARERSTWGIRNAEAYAARVIAPWRFRSADDRDQAIKAVTERVLAETIALTPPSFLTTPNLWHTKDGDDAFHPRTRTLYTTREVWLAEERLIESVTDTAASTVPEDTLHELLFSPVGEERRVLSADQATAVEKIARSGRRVDVLVGPAGAGKTTSLLKLRQMWEETYGEGSVRGLAPTARAAEVLAESLGIETENTAKWIVETTRATPRKEPEGTFEFELKEGDLLIIDEASIAGTMALDTLRAQATAAGAKLLLVGDWAQLAAVDAGGAFGLITEQIGDPPELVNLHRFKAGWEGAASKLLRLGNTGALEAYIENDRIEWGFSETLLDHVIDQWKEDTTAGLDSLLIATTNEMVQQLNETAQSWLIETGVVNTEEGMELKHGAVHPGDKIVTRKNNRTLFTTADRWVKNNDEWTVLQVLDGALLVGSGTETVILPGSYVAEHVQLAYATTAHRSQGRTVDTAHTLVDSSAARESFYVAMTRGKQSNKAYVLIDPPESLEGIADATPERSWREVLEGVISQRGGDLSAHETVTEEAERVGSIHQLAAEYTTISSSVIEDTYLPVLLEAGFSREALETSESTGPLLMALQDTHLRGYDPAATLEAVYRERELESGDDPLAVLHYRLSKRLERIPEPENASVLGVVRRSPTPADERTRDALMEREHAIQVRAELVLDRALENSEPWTEHLGTPILGREAEWRRAAVRIAAYRDLHQITSDSLYGAQTGISHNRWTQMQQAQREWTAYQTTPAPLLTPQNAL